MSYEITTSLTLSPATAPAILSFMQSFYSISDTESQHDAYVNSFTPDATLVIGPKVARGTDEIRALRHGLWTHVARRKHSPTKIFFGGENELMLYGTLRYVFRADKDEEVEIPWAGRVVFDDNNGEKEGQEGLRMRFYQVYLDPSAQSGKK